MTTIFGKKFGMDLVCLLLIKLDVIPGMNWLEFNHVHINYFNKIISFPEFVEEKDLFVSAKQVEEYAKDWEMVFMVLVLLDAKSKGVTSDLPVVCEFSDVFLEDIDDLPLELEVEFTMDLVPTSSPISMAPYQMSTAELNELKKATRRFSQKEVHSF
ncbi:uncharacterized protein LOC131649361 [Vicia villosa]|uniref:uncharacterized protein LOC131649361 n=1 Tax=Vicia villosa TaxID=3911 RepID=UPI00273AB0E5|nr:uncharacterized protein LOC131649361 [Vicia villosa]